MDTYQLLEHAKFSDAPTGNATAIHKSKYGRVIVFALRDGQALSEHAAPAPVNVVVIQGRAIFTGREGVDVAVAAPVAPGSVDSPKAIVRSAGHSSSGAVASCTVITRVALLLLPQPSVAVHARVNA